MIGNLQSNFDLEFEEFEKYYSSIIDHEHDNINKTWIYLDENRGKRIRPMMSLLICGVISGSIKNNYSVAALIEIIHTCSLIQDDIIDKASHRRGLRTINKIAGNKFSLYFSMFISTHYIHYCALSDGKRLLDKVYGSLQEMIDAEIQQAKRSLFTRFSDDEYYEIIKGKTASLFKISFELGAYSCTNDEDTLKIAARIGNNIGIAFQILDDISDFVGGNGKERFNDIYEGKITLPLMVVLKQSNFLEKMYLLFIVRFLPRKSVSHSIIERYLKKYNGIEQAIDKACGFIAESETLIHKFPDSIYKDKLINILETMHTK
ncbi:polyprenyl synthetase family protein [Spirosoma migulaei]